MSLLPDVERELLRVARQPIPPRAGRRPSLSGALVAILALLGLAVGAVFLATLHHGRAIRPAGPRPSVPGTFPGAPSTQRGDWTGGGNLCPLARRNRYLPARSGCVTVLRADVDGDGRPDLVLLYARLTHRRVGSLYVPTSFVLQVVRASGGVLAARLPHTESNPTIVEFGNVNALPGVELFIQVGRISSGSDAVVYSVRDGRLSAGGATLAFGGDSGAKAGFACRAGHPPTIIQHLFVLQRGGERGWWQQTDTTYAWHGATLTQIGRGTSQYHGAPPAADTGLGVGCRTSTGPGAGASGTAQHAQATAGCTAGELAIALGPEVVPQTGEHADAFTLRNRSARACALRGYPAVILSHRGKRLPFVYRHGGGPYVTTKRPRTVALPPGGHAYVLVAQYRCDGKVEHPATSIRISLPANTRAFRLSLNQPGAAGLNYCKRYPGDQRIDPGNVVVVSPIEPTFAALH